MIPHRSQQPTILNRQHEAQSSIEMTGNRFLQKLPFRAVARDHLRLTWSYMMGYWISLFYMILMFENHSNHWYQWKIKKTHRNITVAQKGHCRALFLFIFFNQRQLDACDVEAFTKVTFYPKNYTTSNYILWRSKAANSVQNRIKAGLVQTHHMRLFCMPSLTVCSVRAEAKMTILH